tara:strand:+ start:101 stop:616 length:516 start_codon:yes stop_codon:yes gene_type:complete
MAIGIQPGTTAWDERSLKLDKQVKSASKVVFEKMQEKYPELEYLNKLPKNMILDAVGACQPDGGVWLYKGRVVAAFEAKKQNDRGNAIERWYKNFFLLKEVNKRVPYITFAIGAGAQEGKPIWKALYSVMKGQFNQIRPHGPSCFLKPEGFTAKEIEDTIFSFVSKELENA